MTKFDDFGKSTEAKFGRDREFEFKVEARRNKLLGLWIAEKMGITGANADAYAKDVVKADIEEAGSEDVYRKIKGDLEAAGNDLSEHRVRKAMGKFLEEAREQLNSKA